MNARFRIHSAALTHEGRVRKNNEDSFCAQPERGLWAVADGMGGHENGEWASAEIAGSVERLPGADSFEDGCQAVAQAIHDANGRIWAEAQLRGIQMGSTVVALLLRDRHFAVLWVGDSRAYLLRGGTLYQLSRDHSQVQEMIDRGLLEADAAESHPMSHVLARAVGVMKTVEVDVIADEVEAGDVFLLCSDGLTGRVTDGELAELLGTTTDMAALTEELVRLTLERGAPDNVTVVTVALDETTMLSLGRPIGTDAR